jgi:hypothetical protein
MLEGQVRDLQAQEYLYWHLTGTQVGFEFFECKFEFEYDKSKPALACCTVCVI